MWARKPPDITTLGHSSNRVGEVSRRSQKPDDIAYSANALSESLMRWNVKSSELYKITFSSPKNRSAGVEE